MVSFSKGWKRVYFLGKKKLEKHLFSPKKAGKKMFNVCGHPVVVTFL